MALLDRLRAEFIDIIEWPNQTPDVLVWRFERFGNEVKMGAKLIVRPGQRAVFVNEGKVADRFEPGTYTLETKNLPILATLKGWKYGFNSPFKAEVYFVSALEQLDRKWGTATPVMLRDADFGIVRLRAHGNYSYRLAISEEMLSRFAGARGEFRAEELETQLRTVVVSAFSDTLGEAGIPALDLLAQYDEIGAALRARLAPRFSELGLELLSFALENITVPEDVQKAMDQRASMGAVGDLRKFAQFQAAQALRDAASNPSGAGHVMGMMVGGQLGGSLGGVLTQDTGTGAGAQPAAAAACPHCRQPVAAGASFCSACGKPTASKCAKCGGAMAPDARFCGQCGQAVASVAASCPKCSAALSAGAKFCAKCGAAVG